MRMSLVVFSASLLIALTGCQGSSRGAGMIVLGDSMQPLQHRFNAEKELPRIVGLFSPV